VDLPGPPRPGTLTITAMIERSEGHQALADLPPGLPVVDPDELAEQYWDMYVRRDGVERFCPPHALAS
jgi:hypothetical protein